MAVDQAVETPQQKGLLPAIDASWAEAPALTQHRHGDVVHEEVDQDSSPPYQTHIIAPIGILQMAVEVFDGSATELYPDAHGCILLVGCLASVL
jgi:hypothetical protein